MRKGLAQESSGGVPLRLQVIRHWPHDRRIPHQHLGDLVTPQRMGPGESYEAAYETLRARVPEGWVMLGVGRE